MYRQMFTPKAMTIYSVGAIDLDEVLQALEKGFGGWSTDSAGLVAIPHPPATFPEGLKVYVTPSVGDSQAVIQLARPAPAFEDAGFVEALAVGRLLGGDFNSRINQVLRETKGYSYGVDARVWSDRSARRRPVERVGVRAGRQGWRGHRRYHCRLRESGFGAGRRAGAGTDGGAGSDGEPRARSRRRAACSAWFSVQPGWA